MQKKIIILGSTGSIGKNTIDIIRKEKTKFKIKLLSTNKNILELVKQAKEFNVKDLIIHDQDKFNEAKKKYNNLNFNFYNSFSILDKLFKKKEIFYSMISIVGIDGLEPSIKLIKYSQNIAIVNKESLICGWNLIKKKLIQFKTNFIPIDSEHFSIYSLIKNEKTNSINKIYITASGGPFLDYPIHKLKTVKLNQALKHPNWKMGKKITIDSSTMMNKVFEVIEAQHIFNLDYKNIYILTHPKSYIHAIVKFNNGLTKILIHEPDMKIPIFNSIYFSEDKHFKTKDIDLKILNNLKFKKIDYKKFPLAKIIKLLPKNNSLYETALITINDYFVSKFLLNKINYKKMINLINKHAHNRSLLKLRNTTVKNIEDIYKIRDYVSLKLDTFGI
jgi:1-deoxy-D-xylulose-5-phosphate reductoisomerase